MSFPSLAVRAGLLASLALAAAASSASAGPAPRVKLLPNLTVAASATPGQFTVSNVGGANAGAFTIRITMEYGSGVSPSPIPVTGLKAGKKATYSVGTTCGYYVVTVDSTNTVRESDEVDNSTGVNLGTGCTA